MRLVIVVVVGVIVCVRRFTDVGDKFRRRGEGCPRTDRWSTEKSKRGKGDKSLYSVTWAGEYGKGEKHAVVTRMRLFGFNRLYDGS